MPRPPEIDLTDGRIITHDGAIWPLARDRMVSTYNIRARMLDDVRQAAQDAGAFESVCDETLIALGWSPEQVRRHGPIVARHLRDDPSFTQDNASLSGEAA